MTPGSAVHDVLVVGGGPSGAACAYWLAEAGHDVLLVEKKRFPREKTCGDGLTPRAVRQLEDMGLAEELANHHRFGGLRSIAFGKSLELEWPKTPSLPRYGYVVTRHDLDAFVAERSVKAGATLWQESEATAPVLERGVVRGAVVKRKDTGTVEEVRARYVVVADGANSRFGRALGTGRDRTYPQGMAIRGYFTSPRHDEPWIESHLDVRDKAGNVLPGYGWHFPVGDGRETGRFAADALHEALTTGNGLALQAYDRRLQDEWGLYYRVARAFVRVIGHPDAMRVLVGTGMHSRTLMEWVLRIMSNMLRPDELGPAEAVYKSLAVLARVAA